MKILYDEGVAIHIDSESCGGASNCAGEALTGVRAGPVLSREKETPQKREVRGADAVGWRGRQHWVHRQREVHSDPARSQTRSMHASTSCGNREIPPLSARSRGSADRTGNLKEERR